MAEESPLPPPLSSDTSSFCLNGRTTITNKYDDHRHLGNQQPTLALSPPSPASLEDEQSLIRSPKKPKWSSRDENPTDFVQEVERVEERENSPKPQEKSRVADESEAETSGGNHESVQGSDELLNFNFRTEFAGFELEKKNHDFEKNWAIVEHVELKDGVYVVEGESLSNFEELDTSYNNCSNNEAIELELEKNNGNFEGNDSEFVELESEKGLNGDASEIDDKMNRTRDRSGDSKLVGVAAGASNGGGRRFVYSRKEMEALRFVNVKAQKKFWQQIRDGLEKTIQKEYNELGNLKHQKKANRHQNAETRNYNGQGILASEDMSCDAEITSSMDGTFDDDINGKDSNDFVGEWSEQEESDDEYESIQRPAFLVDGEPDFESGPPEDGLEYLRRVRWEAAQIPKVKVAKIDNSKLKKEQSVYMPKIPDIEKCPPHLAPSKQWEDEFIADFSELRLALSLLEDTSGTTPTDPQTIIFGPNDHKSHSSKSPSTLELPTSGPTLSTLLDLEPATRVAMLKKRISLFENASNLSKNDCAWLFALCAAVDTPLDADTCASLRCLLRKCAKLRAGKAELDDEVVMLNVLATISGKFFGQSEN